MPSAEPRLGGVAHRLADLEAVLAPLVPALERLHAAQIEQRRVVVVGDLSAMVSINTTIEETGARIALLEQRRQAVPAELEAELEAELGVDGLRAVLTAAAIPPSDRARLGQLLVQVAGLVRELREQGRRNADLLNAAMGAARRTRQVLEHLIGADTTYDPKTARRQQAAMRARASLAATPPSPPSSGQAGQAGQVAPAEDGAPTPPGETP